MLGAGPVALEIGQLFMRLGSAVTFITRGGVASREEPETSATLRALLEEEGARVVTHAAVNAIERAGAARRIAYERDGKQEVVEVDEVLVATGRRPNTDALGLSEAGVEVNEHGAIKVSDDLQTTNPPGLGSG